jgi:opacity protein-like surface antigen
MQGYKTIIAAGVVAFLGALQALDWVSIVTNPKAVGWTGVAGGILFAVLRAVTTTPIGKSE